MTDKRIREIADKAMEEHFRMDYGVGGDGIEAAIRTALAEQTREWTGDAWKYHENRIRAEVWREAASMCGEPYSRLEVKASFIEKAEALERRGGKDD